MDYKKIIKNRSTRIRIMHALSFVPDDMMVKLQYRIKTGHSLNLKYPRRFTEKIQWYKLYYHDPLMKKCVDKYDVREYVKQCGMSNILNECYGVYDRPEDIDFSNLPDSFVMKDTLGGGGTSVILVSDKNRIDQQNVTRIMRKWIQEPINIKNPGREWVYDNKKHRIIIEKYIDSEPKNGGLIDYKFFCFYGKPTFIYVIADRNLGNGAGLGIYTPEFKQINCHRVDEKPLNKFVGKPENYNKLLKVAEILAAPFPEARIDLYDQDEKILFGEITFYDGSGYMRFDPDQFDYEAGKKFILPNKRGV